MNALKLTWIRKLKNAKYKWKQVACKVYQNMDDIEMYGPSIYSKVDHSNDLTSVHGWSRTLCKTLRQNGLNTCICALICEHCDELLSARSVMD